METASIIEQVRRDGNRDDAEEDAGRVVHGDLWNDSQGDLDSDSSESGSERHGDGDDNGTSAGASGENGNDDGVERDDDSGDQEWHEGDEIKINIKRNYAFSTRNPRPKKKSAQTQRWETQLPEDSSSLKTMKCCVKLKCFQVVNADYLLEKMKETRNLDAQKRKELLNSMLTSRGTFILMVEKYAVPFSLKHLD